MQTGSSDRGRFGATPAPVEIEIELTNRCNAACVACPRDDMPSSGRMAADTLDRILDIYDAARAQHPLNTLTGSISHPRVTLAGGGEPMLHRDAIPFIGHIAARGYPVHLITNGSLLTASRADELVASGVGSISCSFWGIRRDEYEAAMKLDFDRTLERVLYLGARCRDTGIPFEVTLVRVAEVTSSPSEIAAFWRGHGIDVDLSDTNVWNRAGALEIGPDDGPPSSPADETVVLPDTTRRIWCADLYFTDAWTWDGRCVLCSCVYFHAKQHTIADLRASAIDIGLAKQAILERRPIPPACRACRQPRRLQAAWLARPWKPFVDDDEWAMVTYT